MNGGNHLTLFLRATGEGVRSIHADRCGANSYLRSRGVAFLQAPGNDHQPALFKAEASFHPSCLPAPPSIQHPTIITECRLSSVFSRTALLCDAVVVVYPQVLLHQVASATSRGRRETTPHAAVPRIISTASTHNHSLMSCNLFLELLSLEH